MQKSILIPNIDEKAVYQSLETDYNTILETITKVNDEENSANPIDVTKSKRCGGCKKCKCSN